MAHVFISHSSADKPFVRRLASDLRSVGVDVWFDDWEITVGESIVEKVSHGIGSAGALLLVMSPSALASDWVMREYRSAIMIQLKRKDLKIFPVLIAECQVPDLISDLKYADLHSDYELGLADLLIALGISSAFPRHLSPAKVFSAGKAPEDGVTLKEMFPKDFRDYPQCLFEGEILDATIVLGGSNRESDAGTTPFTSERASVDLFGTQWNFTRRVTPGTVRDAARAADLSAFLGFQYGLLCGKSEIKSADSSRPGCVLDLSLDENMLKGNLILVGGADTNVFIAIASMAFRQKFGYGLPIAFSGDESLHFTCDAFTSQLSGDVYPRLEDSDFMHCGYILITANPWASNKVIIYAIGTRATGTQAALLALMKVKDCSLGGDLDGGWRELSANNRFDPRFPAKVVRATKARTIDGKQFIDSSTEESFHPRSRISQRHVITGFEYLE